MATVLNTQQLGQPASIQQFQQQTANSLAQSRQRAQESALYMMENAKQQANELGISVADLMQANPGMYRSALNTLMRGNQMGADKAWADLQNQPRSPSQIINFEITKWAEEQTKKGLDLFDKIDVIAGTPAYKKLIEEGQSQEDAVKALQATADDASWTQLAQALKIEPANGDWENPDWRGTKLGDLRDSVITQIYGKDTKYDPTDPDMKRNIIQAIRTGEFKKIIEGDPRATSARVKQNLDDIAAIIGWEDDNYVDPMTTTTVENREMTLSSGDSPTNRYAGIRGLSGGSPSTIKDVPTNRYAGLLRQTLGRGGRLNDGTQQPTQQVVPMGNPPPQDGQEQTVSINYGDNLAGQDVYKTIPETPNKEVVTKGLISTLGEGVQRFIDQSGPIVTKSEEKALQAEAQRADNSYKESLIRMTDTQIRAMESGTTAGMSDVQKELAKTMGAEYDSYLKDQSDTIKRMDDLSLEEIKAWNTRVKQLTGRYGLPDPTPVTEGLNRRIREDLPPLLILNGSIGIGSTLQQGSSGDVSMEQVQALLNKVKRGK